MSRGRARGPAPGLAAPAPPPGPRRRRPGRVLACSLGLVAAAALPEGAGPRAQDGPPPYPIYTADHLARTMETLGPNFVAAVRALDARDHPAAKERLARAREQLATTITFWRRNERNDGVGFVRTAVRAMDDLDAAMSADVVDPEAASGLAGKVRAACDACHATYREADRAGGFRLKAGSVR